MATGQFDSAFQDPMLFLHLISTLGRNEVREGKVSRHAVAIHDCSLLSII